MMEQRRHNGVSTIPIVRRLNKNVKYIFIASVLAQFIAHQTRGLKFAITNLFSSDTFNNILPKKTLKKTGIASVYIRMFLFKFSLDFEPL